MIEVKAPGKIMLAGEWAVLEPGNSCIVLPVEKYVTARIDACYAKKTAQKIIFNSQDINLTNVVLAWDGVDLVCLVTLCQEQILRFNPCFTAMQKSLQFLSEQGVQIKPFELTVSSEISTINNSSNKPGLGSSAAVVVAVCKAILKFHDFDAAQVCHPDKNLDIIFKLACLSHFVAFGKLGSGFDVACSTYKTSIIYSRFDPEWLKLKLESKDFTQKLSDIIFAEWPNLKIKEIKLPENMRVLIGFTGHSAATIMLIEKVHKFRQENLTQYKKITKAINCVVLELIKEIEVCGQVGCDQGKIVGLINQNRELLVRLGIESGVDLETQELRKLVDIAQNYGAAAKLSGAGGGDCGIAVCFDDVDAKKIEREWRRAHILNL